MKTFALEVRLNVFGEGRCFHYFRCAFTQHMLQRVVQLHCAALAQVILGKTDLLGDDHLVIFEQSDPGGAGLH